jgi:signal transduction histidine kinase
LLVRPKPFLTFTAICLPPLLILSLISLRFGLNNTESLLRDDVKSELAEVANHYGTLARESEHELMGLARGPLPDYVRLAKSPEEIALIDPSQGSSASGVAANAAYAARKAINDLPYNALYYAEIACFGADRRLMFFVQPKDYESPTFRTKDLLPGVIEPDEGVWNSNNDSPRCSPVSLPAFGDVQRCSVPIFLTADVRPGSPRGALVTDIRLDSLFETAANGRDITVGENLPQTRLVIVVDSSMKFVYHSNDALRNQPINTAMSSFAQVAAAMASSKGWGTAEYRSAEGERWLVAYERFFPDLSLAVARNYSLASQNSRRWGWLGVALSIVFGLAAAALLTVYSQKKTQRLEQVTESVAAIASGNLDQRVQARSKDDLRPIADNINLMTERLREQIAREAESRQFESFVKLSAMLTHDLKNAIGALSLTVRNMERHFDNPEFRADAMNSLTGATDKLRALVARLSNPVNTLSGEFKVPKPIDLVPLLKRVLAQTAEPLRGAHDIDDNLPPSLMALADRERIEKVMENLVLNAIESMSGKNGKLTVEAGSANKDKVFFSVTDTGSGMSPEFIQKRLFHPFATTKNRGVGLGLYTCREVVRANGGSIEVESVEGSGTTFRVVLASATIKEPAGGSAQ